MNKFNWVKAIGFGVLIWAIMFFLVWATITMGMFSSIWSQVVLAVLAGIMTYAFASNAKASDIGPAFGYGAIFVAIGIVLDLIISQRLVSGLFGMWTYYLTYAAILFAPGIQLGLGSSTSTHTV